MFYSCENITFKDFGPNDIANILDVVVQKDPYESAPKPTEDNAPADSGDLFAFTTEPETEALTETVTAAQSETATVINTTENMTAAPAASDAAQQSTDATATEPASSSIPTPTAPAVFATVIDIRTVFPDAPEKFIGDPFPESVHINDALKKNIKNLANFSTKDFKGMYFYILTTDNNAALFKPLFTGEMLSDARRYRTNIVDTACDVHITTIPRPRDTVLQDIKATILSDNYVSDMICVPFDIQSELIKDGLLMNLKKIPYLNPNAEYYNASATEAFTINGNIYGLVSDLTFDPANIYAVFYNKDLIKKYNLSNPVEMYKEGKWNYNAMFDISKELCSSIADLNDDSRWSIGLDKENADIMSGLFVSSGGKYFTSKDSGFPVLNFNNDKTLKLIDAVSKIFAPQYETGMDNYLTSDEWNQNKAFSNGNVLFSVLKLSEIPDIANTPFVWGLLPVPALDENGYGSSGPCSFTDNNALGIAVLNTTRNTEACGIVASALSIASHKGLKEVYVKEQMTYNLRDVDSVKILRDIVNNISFSQYNTFSTFPEFYNSTAGVIKEAANKRGDFSSLYEYNKNILNDFFKTTRIFDRN